MIGTIVLLFLYFLPTLVAYGRNHPSAGAVMVINVFLGWTFIGWILALAWSLVGGNK